MAETVPNHEIVEISVEKMKLGSNVRKDPRESDLLALGESLKLFQYQPVILTPDFVLLDGWRRWLASKLVKKPTLQAVISHRLLSASEMDLAQLTISVHRAGLTGGELYWACYELLQRNPNWLAKDLAGHLKLDPSMMTRILSPSKCIAAVREALKANKIGLSDCYAISKAPDEKQPEMLELALQGASRAELERHRRPTKRRWNGSSAKQARITVPLPSGITVVFCGDKVSIDDVIQAAGEVQREAKRGRDQHQFNAATFETVMRQKSRGESLPETANA